MRRVCCKDDWPIRSNAVPNNTLLKYTTDDENERLMIKEHDHLLPIANVGRIMKQILPSNAKISKEAKETMQECVSEFISFVTGEASDKCHREKRKTVNGDDICWALGSLGFDDYGEALKRYLVRYREAEAERAANNQKDQRTDDQRSSSSNGGGGGFSSRGATFGFDVMDKRRN
ncbi:hypothetical protein DH2020_013846 [Rehmannia glutinosa]|uniref:Transcription factor CBF/NF-Y/archaeal histone domain-containing protein n=1 Tax=Rehmannia glutinosa TaxID=99300 RepID=A0ABR0X3F9_REHGL